MYAASVMDIARRLAGMNALLLPYAVPHSHLRGREGLGRCCPEDEDETRFPFQRDRDRIIHTQAFRRLKGKTQVFVVGRGDHYRTRLTHTMEVVQISRDMARTLGLNEDLAECIALAHDLGHPPFGHAGESALDRCMREAGAGRFEHNEQSIRVVTLLEQRSSSGRGLNLNREILAGLGKHRQGGDRRHGPSVEAQVVNIADEIAYTAHDVDDGLRADLLSLSVLHRSSLFCEAQLQAGKQGTEVRGALIHLLVMDVYAETERRLQGHGIASLDDVYAATTPLVGFSLTRLAALPDLRGILSSDLYGSPAVEQASRRGQEVVVQLFTSYRATPPAKVSELRTRTGSTLEEAVRDYIAGMTDAYAVAQLQALGGLNS